MGRRIVNVDIPPVRPQEADTPAGTKRIPKPSAKRAAADAADAVEQQAKKAKKDKATKKATESAKTAQDIRTAFATVSRVSVDR